MRAAQRFCRRFSAVGSDRLLPICSPVVDGFGRGHLPGHGGRRARELSRTTGGRAHRRRHPASPRQRHARRAAYLVRWPRQALLAIVIAMLAEQMPLADVKNRLSEVVDRLQREHGRVVITKHGRPAAVVLSVEDLESLEETLDVMGSAALLDDIRVALRELAADPVVLSKDDALRLTTDQ